MSNDRVSSELMDGATIGGCALVNIPITEEIPLNRVIAITDLDDAVIVTPKDFKTKNLLEPKPLENSLKFYKTENPTIYNLAFKILSFFVIVKINYETEEVNFVGQINDNEDLDIACKFDANINLENRIINIFIRAVFIYSSPKNNDNDECPCENYDIYSYYINLGLDDTNTDVKIEFTRRKGFGLDTAQIGHPYELTQPTLKQLQRDDEHDDIMIVPRINIWGQTSVDRNDIGDVKFFIFDDRKYSDPNIYNINNKCGKYSLRKSDIKKTELGKCCNKLCSVVKGDDKNLYKKLEYLHEKYYGDNIVPKRLKLFYKRIWLYAMIKYILSKILYGEFDMKYVTQKYHESFLKDLSSTRFCKNKMLFTNEILKDGQKNVIYGYGKYFV